MDVYLENTAGDRLLELEVIPFTIPPPVLVWGQRCFQLLPIAQQKDGEPFRYRETLTIHLHDGINYRSLADARKGVPFYPRYPKGR